MAGQVYRLSNGVKVTVDIDYVGGIKQKVLRIEESATSDLIIVPFSEIAKIIEVEE